MIERCGEPPTPGESEMSKVVFRLISRNDTKGSKKATEEEFLLEIVDHFKDAFLVDHGKVKPRNRSDDYEVLYPTFMEQVKVKADQFKRNTTGYRQICCIPRFTLALVMMSRVRSHYTHANWFRIGQLKTMIDVHGGVSGLSTRYDEADEVY
jgi:hypothetical protein